MSSRNNLNNNVGEIISRMSNLSAIWSINSLIINSISLSVTFIKNDTFWNILAIIIIFIISIFCITISAYYFIMEKQAIFLQKCIKKENLELKEKIYVGKSFKSLEKFLKDNSLKKEFKKIKKFSPFNIYIFFKYKYWSIYIPLILNFIFFIFALLNSILGK